jgi:hypothetical protein
MIKRCLLLGFAILLIGCDARTQVLQEKITTRIDKLLGEFEVKKKQAEIATKKYQEEIDQLTKSKIETKVRLTQLQEKAQVAEAKQAEVDKTILRLRDYLAQGGEVEISGKKYSESQVKEMAEKLIAARKKLVSEIDVMKKSSAQIESIYTSLEAKESKAKGSLEGIKMTLDTIKIKTDALTAMQASSSNSNVGNDLDFESLEQQVAEISNKLDIELAFEQQKTDSNLSPATSIDEIISQTSTAGDTIKEIDSLGIKLSE